MFNKKCPRCNSKIKKDYDFCPFCGINLSSKYDKEDYGFLGRNDVLGDPVFFEDSFFEKILSKTMKLLENQLKAIERETNHPKENNEILPTLNLQFFVNGKRVFPEIKENNEKKDVKINQMPEEKLQKLIKLKKVEPNSKVRRLGQKIIYELEVPGVKNIEDVLINRLENSIEIKALAEDKSYSKTININLPILRYSLHNGNLILELEAK